MATIIELVRYILAVSVLIVHVLFHEFVEGRSITKTVKNTNINKAIIKTIEGENGEIIDCFDIYKQPAFDHPLLRNHTFQMRPSSYPNGMKADKFKFELKETWHKNGKCPARTIPIRRAQKSNYGLKLPSFSPKREQKPHHKNQNSRIFAEQDPFEFAIVSVAAKRFNGAQATLNAWKPTLGTHSELSLAQVLVTAGSQSDGTYNSAQAGWIVNPVLYGDDKPRFFTYWTSENGAGCFNLLCPGFVHRSPKFHLGTIIEPFSTYNGTQFVISIVIYKDQNKGHWWVKLQGDIIGYWPNSIFTTLSKGATEVQWGGVILNRRPNSRHTTTQMGSGHFPSEGFRRASFFRNLGIIDENNTLREDPQNLEALTTNYKCYDVHIEDDKESSYGYHFYYGGPGLSQNCP